MRDEFGKAIRTGDWTAVLRESLAHNCRESRVGMLEQSGHEAQECPRGEEGRKEQETQEEMKTKRMLPSEMMTRTCLGGSD